jgi:hypothetical protein
MTSRILRSGLAEAITAGWWDDEGAIYRRPYRIRESFLATTLAAGLILGGMRYRVVSLRSTTRHYPATRSPRVEITTDLLNNMGTQPR